MRKRFRVQDLERLCEMGLGKEVSPLGLETMKLFLSQRGLDLACKEDIGSRKEITHLGLEIMSLGKLLIKR